MKQMPQGRNRLSPRPRQYSLAHASTLLLSSRCNQPPSDNGHTPRLPPQRQGRGILGLTKLRFLLQAHWSKLILLATEANWPPAIHRPYISVDGATTMKSTNVLAAEPIVTFALPSRVNVEGVAAKVGINELGLLKRLQWLRGCRWDRKSPLGVRPAIDYIG